MELFGRGGDEAKGMTALKGWGGEGGIRSRVSRDQMRHGGEEQQKWNGNNGVRHRRKKGEKNGRGPDDPNCNWRSAVVVKGAPCTRVGK